MLTILHGTSEFLKRERLAKMLSRDDPDGFSTSRFPEGTPLETILAAASTPGFFGQCRVIVVEHLLASHLKGSKLDETLLSRVRALPPSTHLIALEPALPDPVCARLRAELADGVRLVECSPPRGPQLVRWLQERAGRYGVSLETEAAQELVAALCGTGEPQPEGAASLNRGSDDGAIDLTRFDTELAKLATAVRPATVVTAAVVHELVNPEEAPLGWELVDAVRRARAEAILRELAHAWEVGTTPDMLLGQLASHFEAILAATLTPRLPTDVVAAATGLSPARISQARRQAGPEGQLRAREIMLTLRALDAGLKRGTLNDIEAALAAALVTLGDSTQPRRQRWPD
jgi:DNA polymerase-3 subunit delta